MNSISSQTRFEKKNNSSIFKLYKFLTITHYNNCLKHNNHFLNTGKILFYLGKTCMYKKIGMQNYTLSPK